MEIEIYKYRLYDDMNAYTLFLNKANIFLVLPSNSYEKIKYIGKKKYVLDRVLTILREEFMSDKVMTRTWADENPRKTLQGKYSMPISLSLKKKFNILDKDLVEYDPKWYSEDEEIGSVEKL